MGVLEENNGLYKRSTYFRKKPVIVSAIQWTGNNVKEVKAFFGKDTKKCSELAVIALNEGVKGNLTIETPKGDIYIVAPDDFIIRSEEKEYSSCKPDVFEATYEAVN